ncbi:MAG: hypothetical protein AABZ39_07125 [Spirochaetota bacterium]
MIKYVLASITLAALTVSCTTFGLPKEDLRRIKTIALVQVKVNSACDGTDSEMMERRVSSRSIKVLPFVSGKSDRMKYLNTQVYAEYIATNFQTAFNGGNTNYRIISLREAMNAAEYKALTRVNARDGMAVARDTIDLSRYAAPERTALFAKVKADAFMSITLYHSVWGQAMSARVSISDRNGTVLYADLLRTESTYIVKDVESPYTSEFEVFGDSSALTNRRHQDEVFTVLGEMVQSAGKDCARTLTEAIR